MKISVFSTKTGSRIPPSYILNVCSEPISVKKEFILHSTVIVCERLQNLTRRFGTTAMSFSFFDYDLQNYHKYGCPVLFISYSKIIFFLMITRWHVAPVSLAVSVGRLKFAQQSKSTIIIRYSLSVIWHILPLRTRNKA